MDDKKKKYTKPEADVVDFKNDDIITESLTNGGEDPGFGVGEDWGA